MLSDPDKARYARQILLSELGLAGQERLAAADVRIAANADARVTAVARDYLARAGVGQALQPLAAVDPCVACAVDVERTAGDVMLEDCAAWLLGSFAAVEAIKLALGAGTPAELDPDFVLAREVG
jgi:hypothetical protein